MLCEMNDGPILRRRLPRTEVFAEGVEEKYIAPYSDSMSTIQTSLTFRRANPSRRGISTEQDIHGSAIKGEFTVSEPCDHLYRRRSLPPNRAGTEGGASVYEHIMLVRRTKMPAGEMTTI